MYYRNRKSPYKKYTLYAAVVATTAAVILLGVLATKKEMDTQIVQGQASQNITDNYISHEFSSQEDAGSNSGNTQSSKSPKATSSPDKNSSRDSASSKKGSDKSQPPSIDSYTITVHEGKIAVFKNDEKEPMTVLDVEVTYFPLEDQKLLEEGITVGSLSEARQLLEDYQ